MKFRLLLALLMLSASNISIAQNRIEGLHENILETVKVLAHDSLQGREAGTPQEIVARDFIVQKFEEASLEPFFQKGFIQEFEFLFGIDYKTNAKLKIDGIEYEIDKDYYPLQSSGSKQFSGEIVNVGYGLVSKDGKVNDYHGLSDLQGKAFCIEMSVPGGAANLEKHNAYADLDVKVKHAIKQGATAVVFINTDPRYNDPRKMISNSAQTYPIPVIYLNSKELPDFSSKSTLKIDMNLSISSINRTGYNVAAKIDVGAEKSIVIGAHYDHLGMGGHSSRYRGEKPMVHNGADDNASGVSAIIELARFFNQEEVRNDLKHNIIVVAFSAEEKGLLGSNAFVKNKEYDPSKSLAMLNFDMVGRLNPKHPVLTLIGTGTAKEWDKIIDNQKKKAAMFEIKKSPGGVGGSDHTKFYFQDVPVLFFFTGIHNDYHLPSDDVELLNIDGQAMVIEYAAALMHNLNEYKSLTFAKTKTEMASRHGRKYKVTLGIMPGYGRTDVKGLMIEAAMDNRPASNAGIKEGDIIIKMGDVEIAGMQDYMKALGKFSKGQTIKVVVIRDGKEMVFDVTL